MGWTNWFQRSKDTVGIHAPDGSGVAIVGAEPLPVHRIPNVDNLPGEENNREPPLPDGLIN